MLKTNFWDYCRETVSYTDRQHICCRWLQRILGSSSLTYYRIHHHCAVSLCIVVNHWQCQQAAVHGPAITAVQHIGRRLMQSRLQNLLINACLSVPIYFEPSRSVSKVVHLDLRWQTIDLHPQNFYDSCATYECTLYVSSAAIHFCRRDCSRLFRFPWSTLQFNYTKR